MAGALGGYLDLPEGAVQLLILEVFSVTMLGYALGNVELVRRHFEKVILLIIIVSVLPVLREVLKTGRKGESARAR